MKSIQKNKITILALAAFLFLLKTGMSQAVQYTCSLNSATYADSSTCLANCQRTANCTAKDNWVCKWGDAYGSCSTTPGRYCSADVLTVGFDSNCTIMITRVNLTGGECGNQNCGVGCSPIAMSYGRCWQPIGTNMSYKTGTTYSCPIDGGSSCSASTPTCSKAGSCTTVAPTISAQWIPAGPLNLPSQNSSYLFWTSTNATSASYNCTGPIPGFGATATTGSLPFTFYNAGTERCTITATGPGGSSSTSVSIIINGILSTVGACGSDNGRVNLLSTPTNLCRIGNPDPNPPTETTSGWSWICKGLNGGASSPTCTASKDCGSWTYSCPDPRSGCSGCGETVNYSCSRSNNCTTETLPNSECRNNEILGCSDGPVDCCSSSGDSGFYKEVAP